MRHSILAAAGITLSLALPAAAEAHGKIVRWIGPPDSDTSAPIVDVTAATGDEPVAATTTPAATTVAKSSSSNGLAIVALIVAGLAGILGAAALLAGRRHRSGSALRPPT